jgi:hypothetical protein
MSAAVWWVTRRFRPRVTTRDVIAALRAGNKILADMPFK